MSYRPQILIQNINYKTADNKSIIKDLTVSFGQHKTAIVGRNGIGKSTLLKLMMGEIKPSSGSIHLSGTLSYFPQNFTPYLEQTVIEILGVAKKLAALYNIEKGSMDSQDFETIGDDWDIQSRVVKQLKLFGLDNIELNRSLFSMSGGEITRLWLAKVFFEESDFVILDEPTNNLDLKSKQMLYEAIQRWNKGLIIVSHDRALLNLMDHIIELTSIGVYCYGGNYDSYIEQKTREQEAVVRQFNDAKKQMKKTDKIIQETKEKHEQRMAKGHRLRDSGSQSKLILDSMKERSGKTSGKLSTKEDRLLKNAKQQLQDAKAKVEVINKIKIELPKTQVPSGKIMVKLENITFTYEGQSVPIINNFSFSMKGPERMAFMGDNGSGKTTLIKLISGILKPNFGEIMVGTKRVHYLDQNISILDSELTVLDNYKKINPDIKETDARFNLANFLFRNVDALKIVSDLSGGERLRAALACVLTSNEPPQLLILDEPTNHLDLESITALESALSCFRGALIVISHDRVFIEKIGVMRIVEL